MRRAFTLVELLVVVTILPFVMVAVSGVYATFIRDIPATTRVLQESTTVLHLLEQIRRDVEGASGLPEQFNGQRADERTLLIAQPGQVIRYQIEEGRIVRRLLNRAASRDAEHKTAAVASSNPQSAIRNPQSEERLWRVRNAVLAWRLWQRDGRAYAVEIHSHVKQQAAGLWREKLANAHVFFIHRSESQ